VWRRRFFGRCFASATSKAMVAGRRLGWKKLTLTQTASIDKVKTGRVSAMKQPTTQLNVPPQPQGLSNSSIDTATLELLAAWKSEDATTDPEKLREADKEVATFKKAMNENRAASGARLLFP
jgi:hypothetical protein